MAKSSWLTVFPMSGSGSATLTNTGTNHTGRNIRSTTVTATVKGLSVSRSYTVVQKALEEFVSITGDASVSVDREGQTLTLSGLSNSSKLTFASSSTRVTVSSSYTVDGSAATNGVVITGDPGASSQYEFSISVTVPVNTGTSALSFTITATTASGAKATWTLNQVASDIVHTLTLSPSVSTIAAKGGSSTILGTLQTYRNGSLISMNSVTPICTVSGAVFSVSSGNVVSVGTRGTTVGDARSTTVTGSYQGTIATVIVSQEANKVESSVDSGGEVTYGSVSIGTITNATIAASGGTGTATAGKGSQGKTIAATYRTDTYTSEAINTVQTSEVVTTTESIDPSVSSISGTASSKGTTVSEITLVKSQAVTWTGNGGGSASGMMYVYQEANDKTLKLNSQPVTYSDIGADGGAAIPTIKDYPCYWSYTSGSYEAISRESMSISYSKHWGGGSSYSNAVVDTSNGYVTADSLGTNIKPRRNVIDVKVRFTIEVGVYETFVIFVYQQANQKTSIEYDIPSVSLTVNDDIPASGGAISSGTVTYSQGQNQYYTSGASEVLSTITSGGVVSYGAPVSADSLGTTIKSRSKVGTLTATVMLNGKSGSDTADVYQEANEATYGDVTVTATTPVSMSASGGASTISPNASQTVSYTSGSTRKGSVSFAYEVKTSKTGFSLSGATVTVTQNTSTSPRNGFVVMVTATGEGSKLATTDVTFNQAGASVVLPSWNAQDNYNFDADGSQTVQISISDPNNRGWEIRGNSNEFIVVDQTSYRLTTPYSGTGSVSFEFYLDSNTDFSAVTNTVYLYSGSTLCGSFSYVQESGVSLEVTPTELSFVANGESKTITITCNEDWTIS